MIVTSVKTHKITTSDKLFDILDKYIKELEENSVVAVTSKIVAITEGSVVDIENTDKDELIKSQAQYYIPREKNKYNIMVTVSNNTFVASAGIDESNANGKYILWPQNPQESANEIRAYLRKKFGIKNLGVIITDSKTTPMRWGVTAVAIGYSGFSPLVDYIGTEDLFGRKFMVEKMSVIDSLATSAAYEMGEGAESTPMAIVKDITHIKFVENDPTEGELNGLKLTMEEDLYGQLIKNAPWEKGADERDSEESSPAK